MKSQPKYRRPLNSLQLQLLTTLYKFRYATAGLIADSQGATSTRVILARLKVLTDQEYIGQNYDKSYRLIGKPASYYLLPKGVQVLRQQSFADPNVLKRVYYDKNQDDVHITHRLNIFKSYNIIKQNYPGAFQFYSKSELTGRKYIPKDLTDALLKRKNGYSKPQAPLNHGIPKLNEENYFLSYYEATKKTWQLNNSIRRYISYAETEKWQKATKQEFPIVLLVCEDEKQRRLAQKIAEKALETSWANIEFIVLVLA